MSENAELQGEALESAEPQNDERSEYEAVLNFSRNLMFGDKPTPRAEVVEDKEGEKVDPDAATQDEDRVDPSEHTDESPTPPEESGEGVEEEAKEGEGEDEGEDEPKSEVDLLRKQNEALLKQLEEVSAKMFGPKDEEKKEEAPEAQLINFVDEESFNEALASPENFNKILNETMQKTLSYVVRDIPKVISAEVMKTNQVQNTINRFYSENPDLVNHSQYLGHISMEIANNEPSLTLDQNLKKTVEEFRKRTGIKNNGGEKSKAPRTKPSNKNIRDVSQAPAGTSRTTVGTSEQKESMQDEIQKVLAFARRPFS